MRIVRFIPIISAVLIAPITPSEAQGPQALPWLKEQFPPQPSRAPGRKARTPEEQRAISNDIEKDGVFSLPPEKWDALIDAHRKKHRLGKYSDEE